MENVLNMLHGMPVWVGLPVIAAIAGIVTAGFVLAIRGIEWLSGK